MLIKNVVLFLSFFYSIPSIFCSEKTPLQFKFQTRKEWMQACKYLPTNIKLNKIYEEKSDYYPKQKSAFTNHPEIGSNKNAAWQEFQTALVAAIHLFKTNELAQQNLWTTVPTQDFYDENQDTFIPYVQKLDLQKDDEVIIHGDLHGDIHSIHKQLQNLEQEGYLLKDSFELTHKPGKRKPYLLYLGDYVDRGFYGSEVIYTLLRLKIANPHNVILVRGNHEDPHISNQFGFQDELIATFDIEQKSERKDEDMFYTIFYFIPQEIRDFLFPYWENQYHKIYRLYNFLPVALFLGCQNNYIQCCHGGIEHGYKPQKLLNHPTAKFDQLGTLQRKDFINFYKKNKHSAEKIPQFWQDNNYARLNNFKPQRPVKNGNPIGFLWSDFLKKGKSTWQENRGLQANKELTQMLLSYYNDTSSKTVKGIIRGHQHACECDQNDPTNLMHELLQSNGVYQLWQPTQYNRKRSVTDDMVLTLNVSPDTIYGQDCKFGFATYMTLQLNNNYENWKYSIHNPQVIHYPWARKPLQPKTSTFNSSQDTQICLPCSTNNECKEA